MVAHTYLVRVGNSAAPLEGSIRHGLDGVDVVSFGRGPTGSRRTREGQANHLRLEEADPRISAAHARLRRTLGGWVLEDLGSRNGTFVGGVRVGSVALADGDLIEIGRSFVLFRDSIRAPADEPLEAEARPQVLAGLATLHPALAREARALAAVAGSQVPVVICGETGSGKELVARGVHALSGRPGSFVAVNCGGIPDALVASELFGVRRGAYSDAKEDRPGLFRSAGGGTLFLDEIGDLDLVAQPAFLRALQEREVTPVGQAKPIAVDVRVISATHRRLDELVAAGTFREDLWARLAGFVFTVPPLRARREDMGVVIAALLRRHARQPEAVSFAPDAFRALLLAAWPRNVRELERRLEAALALAAGARIERHHLGELAAPAALRATWSPAEGARRQELQQLLEQHRGNLAAVARALGKDRVQVRRWLLRFELDPATFRR